jgi:hypothetical protein
MLCKTEIMGFQRGIDPRESLSIGIEAVIKELGILMVDEFHLDYYIHKGFTTEIEDLSISNIKHPAKVLYDSSIIILKYRDKFKILKNRYLYNTDRLIFRLEYLNEYILKIWDEYKKNKVT